MTYRPYRTMLTLDPAHQLTRGIVADAHLAHQQVMGGFTEYTRDGFRGALDQPETHATTARQRCSILHAMRSSSTGVQLLVQSAVPGDWGATALGNALLEPPRQARVDLPETALVSFTITVNPVRRLGKTARQGRAAWGKDRRGTGASVFISSPKELDAWWWQRAANAGLESAGHPVRIIGSETLRTPSKSRNTGGDFGIKATTITGRARVVDRNAFEAACRNGIGREKAYGCGLLLPLPVGRAPHSGAENV